MNVDRHGKAVEIRGLEFAYRRDHPILDISELEIRRGERVFLFGPSGSGKTTVLGILAGVLKANRGVVQVLGRDMGRLSGFARDRFRGAHIGYVFQMFNLIPYLDVLENITLACRTNRERRRRVRHDSLDQAAREIADRLKIGELLGRNVTELSVGQQQRVAVARALLGSPELIIADEPTSSLDTDRREEFLNLLLENCAGDRATLIFVSHDRSLMPLFDRKLALTEINRAACSQE